MVLEQEALLLSFDGRKYQTHQWNLWEYNWETTYYKNFGRGVGDIREFSYLYIRDFGYLTSVACWKEKGRWI